ncbi:hsp70 family chaperone [Emericellopsis cladophorae]|uniref:Hsp70 family chaperone n=1 Tax=Emericellopsis cladophorae TaxID=2686198 RepID=A0A9P9XTQ5_9HYPO|nr:hsp70 family chaperone [Emericellopsis cladophorae]KAI6777669.1 hsp70 family chaperone [Emericellopsis cladophorae]
MEQRPDILVSVDLGTTYTGVAWMTPRMPVQVINNWPSDGGQNERKVPTTLLYNGDGVTVSSWGFACAEDDPRGKIRREFFKVFLDGETLSAAQSQGLPSAPASVADAQRMVADFLRQIYAHLRETIEAVMGGVSWDTLAVRFLFSCPTTWDIDKDTVNNFKAAIRAAGFGAGGFRHSAVVDLTEAEAAAVATLKMSPVPFDSGSLFLTVDAGGGTTDLALMRITSNDMSFPQMAQVKSVDGMGIGGSLIDIAFRNLVQQRLAMHPDVSCHLPQDLAPSMARSPYYISLKHKFGQRAWMQAPVFKIRMDGVSHEFSHPGLGVEAGCMVISRDQFQAIFDRQVQGVIARIDQQLDWVRDHYPNEQVRYMMLSGGLGSSVYVKDQIAARYANQPHPAAVGIRIVPCNEPQLVVARGLLLDEQQKWQTGSTMSVLSTRVARASYGIIVMEEYVPSLHYGETVFNDRFDPKKQWVSNQIQWLIKKGDMIHPNVPLSKPFHYRLAESDLTRSWTVDIITSRNEPSFLPRSMSQAGAIKLCEVKCNLNGVAQEQLALQEKKDEWWELLFSCLFRPSGYRYRVCQFDVRVIVAPADLRFETWFQGQKFSGNHQPIEVKWESGAND